MARRLRFGFREHRLHLCQGLCLGKSRHRGCQRFGPSITHRQAVLNDIGEDIQVINGTAYIASDFAFRILDVSNPASVSQLWQYEIATGYPTSVFVDGNTAYLTTYSTGLLIFDVTNPASPTLLGNYAPSSKIWDVFVKDEVDIWSMIMRWRYWMSAIQPSPGRWVITTCHIREKACLSRVTGSSYLLITQAYSS